MSMPIGDVSRDNADAEEVVAPPTPGSVARRLRRIASLASLITPADLVADEAQDALAEIAFSYGFARLTTAARTIRLADDHLPEEPLPDATGPCHGDGPRPGSRHAAYVVRHLRAIQESAEALHIHPTILNDPYVQEALADLGRSVGMARIYRDARRAHHLSEPHACDEEPL